MQRLRGWTLWKVISLRHGLESGAVSQSSPEYLLVSPETDFRVESLGRIPPHSYTLSPDWHTRNSISDTHTHTHTDEAQRVRTRWANATLHSPKPRPIHTLTTMPTGQHSTPTPVHTTPRADGLTRRSVGSRVRLSALVCGQACVLVVLASPTRRADLVGQTLKDGMG
ncbi:unnamed protein product [Protopolystoma xenopodis]|uniref:Uncharacterized protein n=1 Tax=Protopolystoma xenopodis TaxID=117903 RepID=A0A3S5AT02_9PLAT|nr:unnamed protein product [Protopolystoma xenopodis]